MARSKLANKMVAAAYALAFLAGFITLCCCSGEGSLPRASDAVRKEISSYQQVADKIIDYSLNGPGQNQSYDRLAVFTDAFGSRISGSQNLENAIDYMLGELDRDGLDNVHPEAANVTRWLRNKEFAKLVEPRDYDVAILGLGTSVGTPESGILAYAMVVRSFDELENRSAEVPGKIVIYNQGYVSYGVSVAYRGLGASRAAKHGAVATLIRSVAPFSIHSPHTGVQDYQDGVPKIPTACISIEDAEMFDRMEARGTRLRIHLKMGAENLNDTASRNTIAEIKGSEFPEQVVLVSGHLDSWDVGQGAMDDGGGAFISWQALTIVRRLGLVPRRTIRLVLWTDEEAGGVGSYAYYLAHRSQAKNISIAFESDEGVFTPYGIQFTGSENATAVMREIGQLLKSVNSTAVYPGGGGTDVGWWAKEGVPTGSLANHNERYFWFHHSDGDTMSVMDPIAMNQCSAVWAVYAYVLADMEGLLPR